ncbi:MAG: formylglycine-generating enzyme family protein [Saprospiraceae bacterium]
MGINLEYKQDFLKAWDSEFQLMAFIRRDTPYRDAAQQRLDELAPLPSYRRTAVRLPHQNPNPHQNPIIYTPIAKTQAKYEAPLKVSSPSPKPTPDYTRSAAIGLGIVCLLLLLLWGARNCGAEEAPDSSPIPPPSLPAPVVTLPQATTIADIATNMVHVAGGTYTMGCLDGRDTDCYDSEKPPHEVTVSTFYISKYEVTQAQWRAVMGSDPEELYNTGCDQCPVERVSWDDIQDFLRKLNTQTGQNYRLPTEAEWEYAARGGNASKNYLYSGSNKIDEVAWYDGNYKQGNTHGSEKTTRPVGGKKSNELGLYDMSGNVWEWCEDDWHSNYSGAPTDGRAWVGSQRGALRVLRGGSWYDNPRYCRAAGRYSYTPATRGTGIGFRLARS